MKKNTGVQRNKLAIFEERLFMNKIDDIYKKSDSKEHFSSLYIEHLCSVLNSISFSEVAGFIDALLEARERNAAVYFIGNGGSAATASHFANDIAIGTRSWEKPFRAQSLCDNQAVISAIANDDGYEYIFSQQLSVLLKEGDVVVAISASGNSANLLKALDVAHEKNALTIGLTAFDGGQLRKRANLCVHVPTGQAEYGPAEDAHMVLNHLVGAYLMRLIKEH